jgi:hypothetical protein
LILLVFYLPKLSPEVHEDAPIETVWQTTDRFKHDYTHARECAIGLGSYLGKENSDFFMELEETEERFLYICHKFHQLEGIDGREVKNGRLHLLCRSRS